MFRLMAIGALPHLHVLIEKGPAKGRKDIINNDLKLEAPVPSNTWRLYAESMKAG
jgi:hypothetical protein